jgi:hypothetical protein
MEETKLAIEKELEQALKLEEPDPKVGRCGEVLATEISKETCQSFRAIRRRAMCRAWEIMEKEKISQLGPPLKRAWAEAREQCNKLGVYSEEEPVVEKAVELVDKEGKRAGTISLMKDGHVEFCHRDIGCEVSQKPSPESYYLTEYFFSEVYGYQLKPMGE